MAKKNGSKSSKRDIRELASLTEVKPPPSTLSVEQIALDVMLAAFQSSDAHKSLSLAAEYHGQAEEIRTQVRALARQQDEVKITLETLKRDLKNAERDGGRVATSKEVLRTDAKNRFLNHKDVAVFRAKVVKNFNSVLADVIAKGLEADGGYQALVAEGILITKNVEKLSRQLGKAEKKFAVLEKKMTRLSADAKQLDEAAWEMEGVVTTPIQGA